MKRLLIGTVLALALTADGAAAPIAPYDGRTPFKCSLQRVGTGTAFPDGGADPFCVKFDKTNQDVSGLGIVEFLEREPDRVAAAGDKCFYSQRDEWRGSLIEGGEGEVYHWKGAYFFDRARGAGGVFVREVRIAGQEGDPTWIEYVPEPIRKYMHPSGGGGYGWVEVEADRECAARVDTRKERHAVYRRWYRGPS